MQDNTPTPKPINPISCAAMLVLLAGTVGLVATSSASATMTSTSMISAQMISSQSPDSDDDDHTDSDDDHDEDHDADDDDDHDEDHDADDDDDHDEDHDADDDDDHDEDHDADDDDDHDHDADDDDDHDDDHDADDDDDHDDGTEGDVANLPDTIRLTGTVRDFQERRVAGGHQDFERRPTGGFGQYVNMVNDFLGADGKPTMRSTGVKLQSNWKDSQGRSIMSPREYLPEISGDQPGSVNTSKTGAITEQQAFDQWFRDTPGVNVSRPLTLTLVRQPGSNVFTFDDREDPYYANLGGFFPVNDSLFGNSAGDDRNFHFTFELQTEFIFEAGEGMNFKFTGDDDVWVYIDDHLVVDIGGVHGAVSQTIDLDRLGWLVDGESYNLTFFFAERHRTQSNFRIETTLQLRTVSLPPTAALYD
jgi:fibro-slime domain-containing protein